MSLTPVNVLQNSQAGFIRQKWNRFENALRNCNPKDLVTKVATHVALSATAFSFGIAGAASISSSSQSTPLSIATGLFGTALIAGGVIRAVNTCDKTSNKDITAEAGNICFTKSLGDLLTGGGLAAAAMGTGFVSFIPIIAGVALNAAASIVSMKKE